MLSSLLVVLLVFITFFFEKCAIRRSSAGSENLSFRSVDGKKISSLHEAAAKKDVELLISKLQSSISVPGVIAVLNQKNNVGQTPLHVAVLNNRGSSHYEVIEILLKNGADPNVEDEMGYTPLSYLLCIRRKPNVETLKLFLEFKADFNWSNTNGSLLNPVIVIVSDDLQTQLDVLKFLVQNIGLDVNHKDIFALTPLHKAARRNEIDSHYELLKFLLDNGADVNARDICGETPLFKLVKSDVN